MALTVQRVEYAQGDDVYEGEWSTDGKRNGRGRLKMATGAEYAGEFMNGFFHGSGVLRFRDGSRFEGHFEYGRYHGYGVYITADNVKYEGQFQQGHVKGLGIITFADGTHGQPRNEGKFDGLKLVQQCTATSAVQTAQWNAANARQLANQL